MSDTGLISMGTTRPELLAPAGDMEAMRAAVANGADAVYFGLDNFNARHRATNFTLESLPEVMAYLHSHNVRGYITVNTLIFSDELPEVVRRVSAIASAGADAVIVQDLGLAHLISRLCPSLPVHASTQMTLTESRGIEWVRRLGVQRVILARELSIDQIARIASETRVPVEVFVHGALCVAYSGQCLTSESLGGRSANRGQCAQACRLPYELVVDGRRRDLGDRAYLLSPQDLAAHDLIGELAGRGVCSFKIEGRLKSAHYVAATTQAYRAALDAAAEGRPFSLSRQQELELAQSFSRGLGSGFLRGVNHQTLVHARFPKSRGVRIGTVIGKTPTALLVGVEDPAVTLRVGDGVVFDEGHPEQDEQGGRIVAVSPARIGQAEQRRRRVAQVVSVSFRRGDVNLSAVSVGAIVWKTDDPVIRKRLEHSFSRDRVAHRVPLHATVRACVGGALEILVRDDQGHQVHVVWPGPLQQAIRHPLNEATFAEQFGRLGDTPYEVAGADLSGVEAVMVPKSVLNDLRRQAVQRLLAERERVHPIVEPDALERLRAEAAALGGDDREQDDRAMQVRLHVLARTLEQLETLLDSALPSPGLASVYCDFEDIRKYRPAVELAREAGVPIALATTRIIKPGEDGLLEQIARCRPDAVLVRNLAGIAYFQQKHPRLPLIGDYSLNVANELTAAVFARANLVRMVPSYDLNWSQMAALFRRFAPRWFEVVIHQHMPMFHMEHCIFCATLSDGTDYRDCGRPCERHRVALRDRVGAEHRLLADVGCRNTVFNARAQSAMEYLPRMLEMGLRHFRVELLDQQADEIPRLLGSYLAVLGGEKAPRPAIRELRVLSQLGVVAGTLDHE